MVGWEEFLYVFVNGAMLAVAGLGLESAIVAPSLDRWDRRFFVAFFSVLVPCSMVFALELFVYAFPIMTLLLKIAYFLDSLLSVVPFPMLAVYLLHCCGEDWKRSPLFYAVLGLWGAYVALLVTAQFTTFIYYVTPDNQLHLGPAYLLSVAPILAMLLLLGAGVAKRRNRLPLRYRRAFLVCLLPVTIAIIVHLFVSSFELVGLGLTISVYSMYRVIEQDSVERDLRQQREIARQRAKIAVLQMRPHFIYNTMASIYYLCDQDPELAKQVTLDFTAYLRKNLAAIAEEDAVPFAEELEHTRAYLAVEHARFGDDLVVVFDVQHTRFRMPPLTLQPIVENAVKHGMDPDGGPLHVWIRVRAAGSGSEVVVEDDGAGIDPAAVGPHATLENIRQRLALMCGGRLDIGPREGDGTVARVTIP